MSPLPRIMVAPNGARRTKRDHPALPVTIPEIVETAATCRAAGAGALHAHVRDAAGRHCLDAGLYRELAAEMARAVPDMLLQVTTEAAGRYTPEEMRALVDAVAPRAVSVALREMVPDAAAEPAARAFYHRAAERGIAVQHIVYSPEEARRLCRLAEDGTVPGDDLSVLFVLGSYDGTRVSHPGDIAAFRAAFAAATRAIDWMVCAFGVPETDCLGAALAAGGKARVGFENSLWHADGRLARDNADRVHEIARLAPSRTG